MPTSSAHAARHRPRCDSPAVVASRPRRPRPRHGADPHRRRHRSARRISSSSTSRRTLRRQRPVDRRRRGPRRRRPGLRRLGRHGDRSSSRAARLDDRRAPTTSAVPLRQLPSRAGTRSYRVAYSGGTGGYPTTCLRPDVGVVRRSRASSASCTTRRIVRQADRLQGQGLAAAAKTKIIVLKKHGKKWKKFKTVRTHKKGRFTVVLPAPRRGKFYWRIVFAGDRPFAPSAVQGTTYKLLSSRLSTAPERVRRSASVVDQPGPFGVDVEVGGRPAAAPCPRRARSSSWPTARLRNHLWSLGTTYHGACSVLVRSSAIS